MPTTKDTRLLCAQHSLEGLSVGNAFGERFFLHPDVAENLIVARPIPASP
ncbi:MAG: hypothetical protein V7K40_00740 [Nostoc sp.]